METSASLSNSPEAGYGKDWHEIYNLVLSYGFLVDQCDADGVANLWLEDGEYEVRGVGLWKGREEIRSMVNSPMHRAYVESGCAHFMGTPSIQINESEAWVHSYSMLVVASDDGFAIDRVSKNIWFLNRTNSVWKVRRRENTLVSGK